MFDEGESFETHAASVIAREHRRRRVAIVAVAIAAALGIAVTISAVLATRGRTVAEREKTVAVARLVHVRDSTLAQAKDIERRFADFADGRVAYLIGFPDSGSALDSVWPTASKTPVEGHYYKGMQDYDFRIWLTGPPAQLSRIRRVVYEFRHPSFERQEYESENVADGFAQSYRGWGVLNNVTVRVYLKDGTTYPISFNMALALERQQPAGRDSVTG
jgi:hypothetical protein